MLGAAPHSMAQQESVLYSFGAGTDGSDPQGDLVSDAAGNFYSTTWSGGTYGAGTVYELTPNADGSWSEQVLYSFGNGTDAANPRSGVIFDAAGRNLYGTTVNGGTHGLGTVFELSPTAGGTWTEKILFSFNGTDGTAGWDKLVFDDAGNLYSTAGSGGVYGAGNIYQLKPHADGIWTQTVLHSFGNGTDGSSSQGGLVFGAKGNLYGMTTYGGTNGFGTVFELSPNPGAGWTETVLHNFAGGSDGADPFAGVVFDRAGNLYGVTYFGQTVFKMTPQADGNWALKTLFIFGKSATQGSGPWPAVTLDAAGNIYGTAEFGGQRNAGTAFEMKPATDGKWAYNVLHSFGSVQGEGKGPSFTRLVVRNNGTVYGVTWEGGAYSAGSFYAIKP
jgi:uncharacterized repeat protein (TIGR03803 family)